MQQLTKFSTKRTLFKNLSISALNIISIEVLAKGHDIIKYKVKFYYALDNSKNDCSSKGKISVMSLHACKTYYNFWFGFFSCKPFLNISEIVSAFISS